MTAAIARWVFPFAVMAAFALFARGYATVGDGFSAGALAGLGAALQYVALDHERAKARVGARWAVAMLAGGLLLAVAVMLAPLAWGEAPVTHLPRPGAHVGSVGVLELHTAVLFDLGVAFAVYGAIAATFDRLFPPLTGTSREPADRHHDRRPVRRGDAPDGAPGCP